MTNDRYIEQDWELEFQKNLLYLLEKQKEIEEEYYSSLRQPATIQIIKEKENVEQIREIQF